ncbi:MAG TPA: tetratricopeptide repeat protein, partial [Bryobacteraceae bacterium]|nr:tetratricopeptide repeat protein [Bryobacteraceae bacterium]
MRVEIGRLRARLHEYYSSAGAVPVRIDIPKGSYVPVFDTPPTAPEAEDESQREPQLPVRISKPLLLGAALAVVIGAALLWRFVPRQSEISSVVVLPFENLTGDPHNDYLADGVTEQLTDSLAQVPTLRVVARTSAFQFKGKSADVREIGRKVNADAVIEGSLRSLDGKVRLTVQVNRSRDGYHIFSRVFEGGTHDLPRLENDMSAPVLACMGSRAAVATRPAPDAEAYDLLLKARAYRGDASREASDHAIGYLHQAIERDPNFSDAYAALAGVYAADALDLASDPLTYANQAKAAAAKALELNPRSGLAYSALGQMDSMILLDWSRGEQELRKSIELMPQAAGAHNHLGVVLMAQGRFPEAIKELQKALDLDPLVAAPRVSLGLAYSMSRNYDEALRQFTEARDLHPEVTVIHAFIGSAWEGKGQ